MKDKLKIAFILPSLANRGPIVFTHYLIESLKNKVDVVDVYYFDNIKEIYFSCNCKKIQKIKDINVNDYDVIQTTMFRPDVFLALNQMVNKKNTIIISGIHNYINEDMNYNYGKAKGWLISHIWLNLLKLFDGVVYSSDEMVNYYTRHLNKVAYKKIAYGISEVKYKNISIDFEGKIKSLKGKNYKIIGAVGLLIKRKGFCQIIEALNNIDDHALVIVGSGPEDEKLKQLVNKYKLQERVIFTGFQKHSTEYYKYFDLYCLCSYSEGFGLAMLEALSAKIPLICSDLDIYKEYFSREYVGLFEPDNIESLINEIRRVNKTYDEFSNASYMLFKSYFDVGHMADKHIEFYKELVNDNE